jgi:hypothetical protein
MTTSMLSSSPIIDWYSKSAEAAFILIRLTRIGGQELAARVDFIAYCGDMVLPAACPEKVEPLAGTGVFVQQPLDMPHELLRALRLRVTVSLRICTLLRQTFMNHAD